MTKVTEHAYMKIYYYDCFNNNIGFPHGSDGKESSCSVVDLDLIPGLGRSPGEGNGYLYPYFAGYSPWGRKELNMTEQISLT